ncbi:MAG: FliA/WhiG family RNA polymerase sigma factor [Phycisphaerae bacterium]
MSHRAKPGIDDTTAVWKEFLKSRTREHRNLLVERYAPLVQMQAARLTRKLPAHVTYEELCSAGYDGLIEAVEAYNPDKKAKFETFCQQRIIGAIMDWLRSLDPQSRTIRAFEKQRCQVTEILESRLKRPPTQEEVAEAMHLSIERYLELSRISQRGREVHFSALEPRPDANRQTGKRVWDIGDKRQRDPSEPLSRAMLIDLVTRGLTREERLVLVLYYCEDLTMAEIGAVLDLSESRVSQIHKDLLERLRKRYKNRIAQDQLVA